MKIQNTAKERNLSLDIIRIVAVMMVIMIHTSDGFVTLREPSSREFLVGNIFDSVAMIAVPLFVMLSGALMLDEGRQITIRGLLRKNIKNIVILMLFWGAVYSLLYNVCLPLYYGKSLSLRAIVLDVIVGHFHMWYLYMIVGLYLITPFLRRFARRADKNMVLFFIGMALCTQFLLPIINMDLFSWVCAELKHLFKYVSTYYLQFFGGYVAYYLTGWYIVHIGVSRRWMRWAIYAVGMGALLAAMLYVQCTGDYNNGYYNLSLLAFVYTVSLFLAVNRLQIRAGDRWQKWIVSLSKLTFGVYIIHPVFLDIADRLVPKSVNPAAYVITYFGVVTVLSFMVSYIISKIPVLKRMVRM